jgi:TonB family protein
MRSVLGIIVVTLLSLQGTANAQFHEEPISTNVPHEPIPLDSLIRYPEEALRNRTEGKVELQAVIDTDGFASEVKILNSSNPVFNTEAIRLMITTKFEHDPNNKSALVSMLIGRTITFELNNKRGLITTSHNSDAYSMLVLTGWSRRGGLIYDDSKLQNIADLNPGDYYSYEVIALDSLIRYPKKARKMGIEGKVIVQALIDKDSGTVSQVEIFKSDNSLLNDEAIRVLKTARFYPSSINGWTLRILNFNLKANPNAYKTATPIKRDQDGGYGVYDIGQEPQEIIPLEKLIHYPEEAEKNRIEGKVTLQALINKDGSVDKVELLKTTDSLFNEEAIRIIKSARFTPAMQNGTPLRVWITRSINFRLKDIPKSKE